ncbi:hypothetical protein [Paenibacillus oryzisoli]|uniref:Uncharacterized protein n=1 Tax=Paenibacillus oryzisoli TaxID=1850517 RepID=A0A198A447_9BACL|nr:hypothetical protein [Paenibacillus oryzisoli]OAS15920.1 hypothetical protein A8708_09515 [Paenibacillus oryzisoli]
MNLNFYSLESEMLQRKLEIEKEAVAAWQESSDRDQIQIFKSLISKFKAAVNTTSTDVQTQAVCCNCC